MHKSVTSTLLVILICGVGLCYARQTEEKRSTGYKFVGTWVGTWQGDGSGKFEMTISKDESGKLVGKVITTPNEGDGYTASFRHLSFEANKMTAKFDNPEGDGGEIHLEGTFDEKSATGNWSFRPSGQSDKAASGTWQATRKQ